MMPKKTQTVMEHYEEDILADTIREIIEIEKDVE